MNRILKNAGAVLLVTTLTTALSPTVSGQSRLSPLLPPQSHPFGISFDEWGVLWAKFVLETELGGATDSSDTIRGVRLLPGNFGNPAPVFDITMPSETPFVAAPFFVHGERYDNPSVPDDDPDALASLLQQIFATTHIQVVLDGRVLLEGSGDELERFLFGPVFLDEPIVYVDPQPRGEDLNAVAALWVMGIGAVYRPLTVGQHTLVYTVDSEFFGNFVFTYNITVLPT